MQKKDSDMLDCDCTSVDHVIPALPHKQHSRVKRYAMTSCHAEHIVPCL